jgi:hypothetical protein
LEGEERERERERGGGWLQIWSGRFGGGRERERDREREEVTPTMICNHFRNCIVIVLSVCLRVRACILAKMLPAPSDTKSFEHAANRNFYILAFGVR